MSYTEEMIQCPYNVHHIILKSRFIVHLCKCRKQYGGTNFSICPFNATHSILTPELQHHINVCPDSRKLDSHLYVVADENKRESLKPVNIEVPTSENWDAEPQAKMSYLDVKENLIMKKPLLRLPVGKSRAQRRQFFANEIQRFETLSRSDVSDDDANGMSNYFHIETIENFSHISGGLGRGIKRDYLNKEKHTDDSDNDSSFAIVLKNRGRGKGLPSSSTQAY